MSSANEVVEKLIRARTVGEFHSLLRSHPDIAGRVANIFRGFFEEVPRDDVARAAAGYRIALTFFENMTNVPDDSDGAWRAAGQELATVALECLSVHSGIEESVRLGFLLGLSYFEAFEASNRAEDLGRSLNALEAAAVRCKDEVPGQLREGVWETLTGALSFYGGDPSEHIHIALNLEPPAHARAKLLGQLARCTIRADESSGEDLRKFLESEEAKENIGSAIEIYNEALDCIDPVEVPTTWRDIAAQLALLLVRPGPTQDAARACKLLEQAIGLHHDEDPEVVFPLRAELAVAQASQGHRDEAIVTMKSALHFAHRMNLSVEKLISNQASLAEWLEDRDDIDEALSWYEATADTLRAERWTQGDYRSPYEQTEDFHMIYRGLTRCLLERGHTIEAFNAVACARARAINERLAYSNRSPVAGVPDPLWAAAVRARNEYAGADESTSSADIARLEEANRNATDNLALKSSAAARLVHLQPLEAEDVSRHLQPHQALLVFYPTRKDVRAFLVHSSEGQAEVASFLLARWDVHKLASNLLESWVVPYEEYRHGETSLEDICSTLDEAMASFEGRLDLSPLVRQLGDGIEHLLIVAHHPFTALPLHLLRLPNGSRLIECFDISFLPSITSVVLPRPQTISEDTAFLGLFDPRPHDRWHLEFSQFEHASITPLFSNASVLSGDAANWKAMRNGLMRQRVAHLSCHGKHDFTTAYRSRLFLANDEVLTQIHILGDLAPIYPDERDQVRQIISHAPPEAGLAKISEETPDTAEEFDLDLLVLSACESSLAEMLKFGDEYFTIPNTFHIAGARAVIGTLWRVRDRACVFLFDMFYRNLVREKVHPAAALRTAQHWLRDATGEQLAEVAERLVATCDDQTGTATLQKWAERQRRPARRNRRPYSHAFFWGAFFHLGA